MNTVPVNEAVLVAESVKGNSTLKLKAWIFVIVAVLDLTDFINNLIVLTGNIVVPSYNSYILNTFEAWDIIEQTRLIF